MGAVLREQNALPYDAWIMKNLTAKDDVDNVGAGRAAKGENPSSCAIFFIFKQNLEKHEKGLYLNFSKAYENG